jgi:hypothetical protein
MPVLPHTLGQLLSFIEVRLPEWLEDPQALGLSAEVLESLQADYQEARDALALQYAIYQAARSATGRVRSADRALRGSAADAVRLIKAFAQSQPQPQSIYSLASIPAPAAPSLVPPPGTPHSFRAALNPSGSLTIRWQCKNPRGTSGTVYHIRRRFGESTPPTPWETIACVGVRRFTDETLAGTNTVSYQVIAQRSTMLGKASTPFIVSFGQGGQGGGGGGQVRIAAHKQAA